MFNRYTDPAKRAVFYARIEANHRDKAAIGPEDLLLGLTWETNSTPAAVVPLKDFAVNLRARLGVPHMPTTGHPYLRNRDIPLSPTCKMAVAYAAGEADAERQYWIDCDHLVRGLLRFENPASTALAECGFTLAGVREKAKQHRAENAPEPSPRGYWLRRWVYQRRYYWIILFMLGVLSMLLRLHS